MLKSLQVCYLEDNEKLLVKHIANTLGNIELCSHLKGLKAVWQELMTRTISDDGHSIRKGFMSLDEGFALFLGFMENSVRTDLVDREKKKRFKELLCHEKFGLCIYIINGFIVIRPNDFDLHYFAYAMAEKIESAQEASKNERIILDKSVVQKLINAIDTEWDKKIARVAFGACRSRSEIDKLGISSHDIRKLTDHVMAVIQARDDTKVLISMNTYLSTKQKGIVLNIVFVIYRASTEALGSPLVFPTLLFIGPEIYMFSPKS